MKVLVGLALAAMLSAMACGQDAPPESLVPPPPTPILEATIAAGAQATVAASAVLADASTPVSTKIPALASSPSPAFKPGTRGAIVTSIVDGDTFVVAFQDGSVDSVQLLGVDTPEIAYPNNPNEYGDITDTTCLDAWGDAAKKVVVGRLEGQVVALVLDPVAGERGPSGRMLVYIELGGEDFNAALIELGLARVLAEGVFGRKAGYLALQEVAQREADGLWRC